MKGVQGAVGFIQEKDLRFLGQGTCDQGPLPLTSGESRDGALREMKDIGCLKRLLNHIVILAGFKTERPGLEGESSHQDQLLDSEVENRFFPLRDHRHMACESFPVPGGNRLVLEQDTPPGRSQPA